MSASASSATATAQANVLRIGHHLWAEYQKATPKKLQLIDHFAAFAVVNGGLLALYLLLQGSFPYNSFLAAFIAAVAFFIFTGQTCRDTPRSLKRYDGEWCSCSCCCCFCMMDVCVFVCMCSVCLRVQLSSPSSFGGISAERAYAEYAICNLILFFVVITFLG